jgi:hypothetical protein
MRLLGIIDAIESTILDAKRAPFSQTKIVLEEKVILELLHKLKTAIETEGRSITDKMGNLDQVVTQHLTGQPARADLQNHPDASAAKKYANEIKAGADKYALEILSQLELLTTRIHNQILNGKEKLKK